MESTLRQGLAACAGICGPHRNGYVGGAGRHMWMAWWATEGSRGHLRIPAQVPKSAKILRFHCDEDDVGTVEHRLRIQSVAVQELQRSKEGGGAGTAA